MFDPKDDKTIGYHLFLLPQGELFNDLQSIINQLAEKYHGPKFDPHITFLARIPETHESELMRKTKEIASTMEPFEIELEEVKSEDTYFRSFYWKAKPNQKLQEYHQKAIELFNVEEVNTYMPHLSLYYGNIPQSSKDDMKESFTLPSQTKFRVDIIHLYKTEGTAENWLPVGVYRLGQLN